MEGYGWRELRLGHAFPWVQHSPPTSCLPAPLSPCPQAARPGAPRPGGDTGRWQGARAGVASRSRSCLPQRRPARRAPGGCKPAPPRRGPVNPGSLRHTAGWGGRSPRPGQHRPPRAQPFVACPARRSGPAPRCPGGGGPGARLTRSTYLPKQPEDVHSVLPLVLPDGGLDLPQPPHPPHVGRRRGFPQHPGQLLRVEEQGGEVEVPPAALQPAGGGLLGAFLLQAALPAQPGAHGRTPAAMPPCSAPDRAGTALWAGGGAGRGGGSRLPRPAGSAPTPCLLVPGTPRGATPQGYFIRSDPCPSTCLPTG